MKDLKKIEIQLESLGLSIVEVKCYIGLLQLGPSTILQLAKYTKLNRTTAHVSIERLIVRGLVSETRKGEKRLVIAEEPERLTLLIENEMKELKRKESGLKDIVSSIYELVDNVKDNTSTEVKYYTEKRSIQKLYDEILKSNEIRAYVNVQEISQNFPENAEKFINAAISNPEMRLWDMQVDDENGRDFAKRYKNIMNYKFKFLPTDVEIKSMDYLIYDDNIAIIQGETQVIAIVISNKFMYENAKLLFDLMWRLLPD